MIPVNSLCASFSGARCGDSTDVEYRLPANFVYTGLNSYLKTGRDLDLELDPFFRYRKTPLRQSKQIAKEYRFNRFCLHLFNLDMVTTKLLSQVYRR
jgi:hypothetical protein